MKTPKALSVRKLFFAFFYCFVLQSHVVASDYGTTGLIDVPTARFESDGVLSIGASDDDRHRQFHITYQATPWLQGTFRYTGYNDFFH